MAESRLLVIPRWKRSVDFDFNLSFSIPFPIWLRGIETGFRSFVDSNRNRIRDISSPSTENQNREPLLGVQQTCRVAGLKHPPECSLRFDRGEPLARRIRCNKRPARQRGLQDDLGGSVGNTAGSFGGMKSDSTDLSSSHTRSFLLLFFLFSLCIFSFSAYQPLSLSLSVSVSLPPTSLSKVSLVLHSTLPFATLSFPF